MTHWGRIGEALGKHWEFFGIKLKTHGDSLDLEKHWERIGDALGHIGVTLETHRGRFRDALGTY